MAKLHLLLADGEPNSRTILEATLRKAGYLVTSCEDGMGVLTTIETYDPDLILADVRLAGIDAYELVRRIKQRPRFVDVPVVFLSKTTDRKLVVEEKVRAFELGVDDYVQKPPSEQEIVARVRMLLNRRTRERMASSGPLSSRTQFSGSIQDMGVIDLLQTFDVSRKSGILRVYDGESQAEVFFRNGRVVDAANGRLEGVEAIYRLLVWHKGSFSIEFEPVHVEDRIGLPTQALLMEGMRRLDEWTRLLEQVPSLATRLYVDPTQMLDRLHEIPDEVNKILRLFDGQRSIQDVIDASPFEDLSTLGTIAKLYFEGIVVPYSDESVRTKKPDSDSTATIPATTTPNSKLGDLEVDEAFAALASLSSTPPPSPTNPSANTSSDAEAPHETTTITPQDGHPLEDEADEKDKPARSTLPAPAMAPEEAPDRPIIAPRLSQPAMPAALGKDPLASTNPGLGMDDPEDSQSPASTPHPQEQHEIDAPNVAAVDERDVRNSQGDDKGLVTTPELTPPTNTTNAQVPETPETSSSASASQTAAGTGDGERDDGERDEDERDEDERDDDERDEDERDEDERDDDERDEDERDEDERDDDERDDERSSDTDDLSHRFFAEADQAEDDDEEPLPFNDGDEHFALPPEAVRRRTIAIRALSIIIGVLSVLAVYALWNLAPLSKKTTAGATSATPALSSSPGATPHGTPSAAGSSTSPLSQDAGPSTDAESIDGSAVDAGVALQLDGAVEGSPTPADDGVDHKTIGKAQRELERGHNDKAIALATSYSAKYPQDAFGWLILGAAYEQAGHRSKAREIYRTCVKRASGSRIGECRALAGPLH